MDQSISSGGSYASSDGTGDYMRRRGTERTNGALINVAGLTYSIGPNSGLSPEVKELYHTLYTISKQLDETKSKISSIEQIFGPEIEEKRLQLINISKQIIFKDYLSTGKKVRDIMWRRGYYEFVAILKKNWNRQSDQMNNNWPKLDRFLWSGVQHYKRLAAKMEQIYDLDLKYLIDLSLINEGYVTDMNGEPIRICIADNDVPHPPDKSIEAASFALDTIHASLLSLGDLHRYILDFPYEKKQQLSKQLVAKYYLEAFKLNPAIGMAQNQLGTLCYGQNYDLDSIYHYIYSLVSIIPFEPSENNLNKLLTKHANYLANLNPDKMDFSIEDFYARFYLVVDIFFFDKEVPEFNSICHCVLVDLRKVLCCKNFNLSEQSLFKIISIMFFCLSKLKMINSPKIYSLNAFLVAMCSDLIDSCIVNLEQTLLIKSKENEQFKAMYEKKFDEFDMQVRKSRNEYKNWVAQLGEGEKKDKKPIKLLKELSTDSRESQHSMDEHCTKVNENDSTDKHGGEPISTRSSDEAKESDLKTPLSCKSKKRGMKLRRRRRKIAQSDDSSCYDTESEMDTDFFSDDEDYTDLSSNFDTDFSDVAEPNDEEPEDDEDKKDLERLVVGADQTGVNTITIATNMAEISDSEDVVIEEERIIYPDENGKLPNSQEIDSDELLRSFEVLQINANNIGSENVTDHVAGVESVNADKEKVKEFQQSLNANQPPNKLVYRNKYTKNNPNIIIEFAEHEPTIRALKILFDWLRINHEILMGCFHSNPEFVHKIIKLLNYCNIDVFTRKVYFEREFLTTPNVRQALIQLFDVRCNVPLSEDFAFKNFDIFQSTQITLDWETKLRERVTEQEETILRIFKMIDFGFFICKQKKFNYRFCVKSRRFIENQKKKREEKKGNSNRRRERRTARNAQRKRTEGRTRRYSDRKSGIMRKSYTSNEEKDTVEEGRRLPRKGYLRFRNAEKAAQVLVGTSSGMGNGASAAGGTGTGTSASTTTNSVIEKLNVQSSSGADEERSERSKKCEIMGRLWLQNEVETLEEQLRNNPNSMLITPFIVVDAKALTEYNGMVKNLVKSKRCIVLIPNAVFNELDELKKRSENARNVIRWLEQEFKHGNRHLRAQHDNEIQPLTLLKISRKMDREASVFLQIAQFCNHLVTNHSDPTSGELQKNVVTYLSGDNLHEKNRQQHNFSFTGILDSISVRYDQIANFYDKFKANKK